MAHRIQMRRRETVRRVLLVRGVRGEMTALLLSRVIASIVNTLAATWPTHFSSTVG